MESAGVKKILNSDMYQNKYVEEFPETELSATQIRELLSKNQNDMFDIKATVRVIGIREYERADGKKETYYRLEINSVGLDDKSPDEMTPDEILAKIEQSPE